MSGGASVEVKDRCKQEEGEAAVVIRGGEWCVKINVTAEAGVGAGGEVPGAGATAKLVTGSASETCSTCNECGESTLESKCCTKECNNGPSLGGNILILKAEVSLGSLCYDACVGSNGFTHGSANSGRGAKVAFGHSAPVPSPPPAP